MSYGFDGSADLGGGDVRLVLFQVTRRFMDLIFDPEVVAMHRVVMSEAASCPRIATLFFGSGSAATKGAVSGVLRQLVDAGRLRPHDSIEAVCLLLNMSFGSFPVRLLLHLIDRVPDEELDAHLRGVVDDFVRLYGVE